jgi:hypothetical protein
MAKKNNQLYGIKAIAAYLNMSVRNVYYWEKKLDLPIHRVSGSSGYRIYAFKDEIDKWLKEKDAEAFRRSIYKGKLWAVVLPTALLLSVLLLVLLNRSSPNDPEGPKNVSAHGNIVHIENSKGDVLWKFNHGDRTTQRGVGDILDMENVDDDPQNEVVACIYDILNKEKWNITLFDNDGSEIWKRMMTSKHTFGNVEIENFFRSAPVKFVKTKSNKVLIISKWVHGDRFLSFVASHNPEGDLVNQYHHTGHLDSSMTLIDLDGDGYKEIVVGGTNNLLNGEAMLCALPLEGFHGINPPYRVEPEYKDEADTLEKYIADKIVKGNQLIYIRFKKTDILPKYRRTQDISSTISYTSDNNIHIRLNEWVFENGIACGINFAFDRNFTLIVVMAPGCLRQIYPKLLKNGEIDISLNELKKIYANSVLRWDDGRWVPVKKNLRPTD